MGFQLWGVSHLSQDKIQILGIINIAGINKQSQMLIIFPKIHHRVNPTIFQPTHILFVFNILLILGLV